MKLDISAVLLFLRQTMVEYLVLRQQDCRHGRNAGDPINRSKTMVLMLFFVVLLSTRRLVLSVVICSQVFNSYLPSGPRIRIRIVTGDTSE